MTRLLSILTVALALALPAAASAAPNQFSILQDDATLLGLNQHDPEAAFAEAKYLGFDMVRVFVDWHRVSPMPDSETIPEGFVPGDPNSPGYDWSRYDAFVDRAKRNGLKVFLTLSPPLPRWASEEPSVCPHFVGGYRNLGKNCYWKPRPDLFGQFAKAVALRYGAGGPFGGVVDLYSMWNEPNLEHYLYPQFRRTRFGEVDVAAKRYRRLWYEGWKAIARYDGNRRNKVLFGETAAISSPMDTLYAALCLNDNGLPFRGRMKIAQGCRKPRRLPIGGFAIHPYAKDAVGSVFQRSATSDSLTMAYLPRLHRLIGRATRRGRIPRGRQIYSTEFGFQTNPPDFTRGLSPNKQALALNQAERLFARDGRVRAIAQFELFDVPEPPDVDVYNTGLRYNDGGLKPSWRAFRMPLVVTKMSPNAVEVWGQVRPANRRVRFTLTASRGRGRFKPIGRPRTNRSGYFRTVIRRGGASRLRFQMRWKAPSGEIMVSRVAISGRPIRYLG